MDKNTEKQGPLTDAFCRLLEKLTPRQAFLFLVVFLVSAMISLIVCGCAVFAKKDEGQSSLFIVPNSILEQLYNKDDPSGLPNLESNVGN